MRGNFHPGPRHPVYQQWHLPGIPGARRYRNEGNHPAREEVRKVLCPMDVHVDQTFLIEVPFPSDAREVLRRCVVNNLRNSAQN